MCEQWAVKIGKLIKTRLWRASIVELIKKYKSSTLET